MIVKLRTRTVGMRFGTVGQVVVGRDVLHETTTKPFGFVAAALSAAEEWALKHGHEVRS